jgi:hypothetical protein
MGMKADKIIAEALVLSPQARAFVAEKLIESLDATHPFPKTKGLPGSRLPVWFIAIQSISACPTI